MKRMMAIVAAVILLAACHNPKDKEKALLDDVIKVHDKVMAQEDKLMHDKMLLDTLILRAADTSQKTTLKVYHQRLEKAEGAMENWMQNFDATQKGKSHEEIVAYLEGQKKQVLYIDSLTTKAVKETDDYLLKIKK